MRPIAVDPDRTESDDVVRNLVFSADGRRLGGVLGPRGSESVRAWRYDLVGDKPLPNPDDEDYEVERIVDAADPVWSADLELLAEYLQDERGNPGLRVTDLWAKPSETAWLHFGEEFVPSAHGFSADGSTLFVGLGGQFSLVRYWLVEHLLEAVDPAEVPFEEVGLNPDTEATVSLAASAVGPWLACGLTAGEVYLIDLSAEQWPRRLTTSVVAGGQDRKNDVAFSRRGDKLIGVSNGLLSVWDVGTLDLLGDRCPGVTAATFTPDGGVLAATAGGDVVFLDPVAFAETRRLDFGVGPLWGVAVAADGLTAAVGAANGRAVIFDLD